MIRLLSALAAETLVATAIIWGLGVYGIALLIVLGFVSTVRP